MSYANLIANKHQSKQLKKISEDGILMDPSLNCDKIEENDDDFNEKEDNYTTHKKGNSLIFMLTESISLINDFKF